MADLVLMKLFEASPTTFGNELRAHTRGTVDEVHDYLARLCLGAEDVLDLGCGAGELTTQLAKDGTRVLAIDRDPQMAALAESAMQSNGLNDAVVLRCNAFEMDQRFFDGHTFDRIVLSLVLSEQSDEQGAWILAECARRLRKGGKLLVADEFVPEGLLARSVFRFRRLVAEFRTFWGLSLTSLRSDKRWRTWYYIVVETPLILLSFLVSRPLTRPLRVSSWPVPLGLMVDSERRFERDLRVVEFVKT